ncbi:hypothetical protein GE061_000745 [Apolygus lucorum]|uniref:Uncharacterized protein n=1 Tax=Apolygus lucorum TaxID=248454 RepID=A0A8S9Y5F1_APOLU|nr:hypothetical protein GE061_000745 [Apolygus lucorum]
MNEKFSTLATKNDFETLRVEISELKEENKTLRDEMAMMRESSLQKDRRLEYLELQARKKNLILKGLVFRENEDLYRVVQRFFSEILGFSDRMICVSSVQRVGSRSITGGLLLVSLVSLEDKWSIIGRTGRLQGTGYGVSQDYSPEVRHNRFKLLRLKSEIKKMNANAKCVLRADFLTVENQTFVWNDSSGFVGKAVDGSFVTAPSTIMGLDVAALVSRLRTEEKAWLGRRSVVAKAASPGAADGVS